MGELIHLYQYAKENPWKFTGYENELATEADLAKGRLLVLASLRNSGILKNE